MILFAATVVAGIIGAAIGIRIGSWIKELGE